MAYRLEPLRILPLAVPAAADAADTAALLSNYGFSLQYMCIFLLDDVAISLSDVAVFYI